MDKAYDLKDLGEKLQAQGLDIAEDALQLIVEAVSDWVVESAALSASPFDDIAAIAMPHIKEFALKAIDKIDGEDDPER